ncbi:MAG: outer membrane protein assembly factor BamA [Candidatus Omnitrophica bacterium]|jgi:outer membrane protein insertion porin family|nr:outer membrane protein assembly factor BamA [Candidatus Omnitrophota bacterium]
MRKLIILFLSYLFIFSAYGADSDVIARVEIKGQKIVSDATIISKIKIRAGQTYNENVVNEDIKNLLATGFFENADAEKEKTAEGIVITFKVKEKPVLTKLDIEGEHFIRKKKIEEVIDIKAGSFVDEYKLNEVASKIKDLYAKKGFTQTKVTYDFNVKKDANEAEVKFIIEEKGVLKVRRVKIQGNKTISAGRILKLMKTRKAWLFNPGLYKEEAFRDDIKRITDFYRQEGFTDVKVDTELDFNEKGLYITISIVEGKRYYLGTIQIEGYKDVSLNEIKKAMKLKTDSVYSDTVLYEESSRIRSVYVDKGYIFAQIEPVTILNPETQKVDVTYKIIENQVAYIERIDIKGNIKTKDKVIRRELRVYPEERFDGKAVRKSKEKLENLGFFEEVRFDTEPGTKPDQVNLVVDVKEAKTGHLSFGGGYSSIEEFVGFAEIRQKNFDYKNFSTFSGAGQDLSLYASLGSLTSRYELSFTNPWIFDRPYSFGFDVYKKGHEQDEDVGYGYSEDITGGDVRLGKDFNDSLKAQIAYRYDRVKISDVIDSATSDLKDEAGTNDLSSGEFDLSYDTRDNVFSPLTGIYFTNNLQVTGGPFGGSKDFFKYFARFSYYYPLINKSVLEARLRAGWADPFSDTKNIPIYERFFVGGASTVRGYQERKLGPVDPATDDPLGGESMFVANLEYTYPLIDFLKVATFFDAGNVWSKNSDFFSDKLYKSVGLGVRVKTPIGPVSVDYGWPLDLGPGEERKEGRFHFNISRGF